MEYFDIKDCKDLPFGENSHQTASICKLQDSVDYDILSRNKEISYIDFLNLSKAIRVCAEFFDVHSTVMVKNNIICSVSLGANDEDAFNKILDCDPLSVTDSTIGFSKEVGVQCAKLLKMVKIKNVLAPSYSKDAFSILLESNINIIVVKSPLHEVNGFYSKDIKITPFGALIQEQNTSKLTKENFSVVSQEKPSQQLVEDGIFAWKVAKHLQSCAVVIAKDLCTKAIVQGRSNYVTACESAVDIACENSKDAVLVTDGVIDNIEVINAAIQGRIGLIIEAGDGEKSSQILKTADKYGLSVIFTKTRNNRY